ncbi:unnamed protein product [Prunus armeniaca]
MFEMGVKLDMNKVYDREEWDFLEAVMIRMGFTERWVELITVTDLLRRKDKGIDLRPQSIIVQTCKASGQQISLAKSIIFFSPNTPSNLGKRLCHILGISHVDDPERYLGLPTIWGRSKRREVLLKAVVQVVPTYPMHIFVFPSKICFEGGRLQPVANGMVDLEQRVNSIINFDTRNWNLNLIRHLIDDRAVEAISKIKFASPRNKDRLVWPFKKNGFYFVKSWYHWLHSSSITRQQNRPFSSRDVDVVW